MNSINKTEGGRQLENIEIKGMEKEGNKVMEQAWKALDDYPHPLSCFIKKDELQDADQISKILQKTFEDIIILDSCDVVVKTTNIQAALNLQAAIQVAIVAILSITILSHEKAEKISQDLFQKTKIKQADFQRTLIRNSRGVNVHTTDASLGASIQLLIQILVFLLIRLRIL